MDLNNLNDPATMYFYSQAGNDDHSSNNHNSRPFDNDVALLTAIISVTLFILVYLGIQIYKVNKMYNK